ncbi:MAG TPA: DMT family transporter [Ktedonobacteraceae bacterium]|nr:DMT family transporter [Ktedonobacteraceae bacterium]
MRLQGFLYAIATACVFGLGAVLIKLIAGLVDPLLFMFLSLLLGGAFIALFLLARRQSLLPALSRSAWINMFLLSGLGTSLPLVLLVFGLASTSAVTGGFLLQLQGPAGIIFACLLLREKFTWKQGAGTVLLMIGSIIVILGGTQIISWQTGIQGDLLIFISALGFGYSFIPAKRLSLQIGPLQVSSLRLFLSACLIIPFLFFQSSLIKVSFSWSVFWILLLYGLTNFGLGYITLHEGLSCLPAWASAAILQTIPIFTTAFAILLLQDTLSFIQIIGGIIAIAGGIIAVSGEAFPKRFPGISGKSLAEML